MAYLFVPFPMTLDDLEGHSPVAGLIKYNSTNVCATFRTVSTDTALRAVPRRQLSFLCVWTVRGRAANPVNASPGITAHRRSANQRQEARRL